MWLFVTGLGQNFGLVVEKLWAVISRFKYAISMPRENCCELELGLDLFVYRLKIRDASCTLMVASQPSGDYESLGATLHGLCIANPIIPPYAKSFLALSESQCFGCSFDSKPVQVCWFQWFFYLFGVTKLLVDPRISSVTSGPAGGAD